MPPLATPPHQHPPPDRRRFLIGMLAALWLTGAAGGLAALWRYELTPGSTEVPIATWPPGGLLRVQAGLPTLVMAAHPGCPCTRASLAELGEVLARVPGRLTAYVLLADAAPGAGPGLEAQVAAIPGVTPVRDRDGVEARRFGLRVSGETRLYDRAGQLVFAGGLTSARGHRGDSEGRRAVLAFLQGAPAPASSSTAVFGCALRSMAQGGGMGARP